MGDDQERSGDGVGPLGAVLDSPEVAPLEYVGAWARERVEPVHVVVRGVLVLVCTVLTAELLGSFTTAMWLVQKGLWPVQWSLPWARMLGFPGLVVLVAAVPALMCWFRMTERRPVILMALACTVGIVAMLGGDRYAFIRAQMDHARLDSVHVAPYRELLDAMRNVLAPALCPLLVISSRAALRGLRARREIVWPLALLVVVYATPWVYAVVRAYGSAMQRVRAGPWPVWPVCLTGLVLVLLMVIAPSHRQALAGQSVGRTERWFARALPMAIAGLVWLAALRGLSPLGIASGKWPYQYEFNAVVKLMGNPFQIPFEEVLGFALLRLAPTVMGTISAASVLAWLARPRRFGTWLSCCLMVQLGLTLLWLLEPFLQSAPLRPGFGLFLAWCGLGRQVLLLAVPTLVALTLLRSARDRGQGVAG